jgi:hypothetical protein
MTRQHDPAPRDSPAPRPSRRARLHGLLFAGAALGTTLLTLGTALGPKFPQSAGE